MIKALLVSQDLLEILALLAHKDSRVLPGHKELQAMLGSQDPREQMDQAVTGVTLDRLVLLETLDSLVYRAFPVQLDLQVLPVTKELLVHKAILDLQESQVQLGYRVYEEIRVHLEHREVQVMPGLLVVQDSLVRQVIAE